jgi:hypothetical protein
MQILILRRKKMQIKSYAKKNIESDEKSKEPEEKKVEEEEKL